MREALGSAIEVHISDSPLVVAGIDHYGTRFQSASSREIRLSDGSDNNVPGSHDPRQITGLRVAVRDRGVSCQQQQRTSGSPVERRTESASTRRFGAAGRANATFRHSLASRNQCRQIAASGSEVSPQHKGRKMERNLSSCK